MKFANYFFAPGVRMLATFFGLAVGGVAGLFAKWQYGVLAGAGVALFCSLVIPLLLWRADAPYRRVKATLKQPFLIDERVRFTVRNGTVGGFFILTEQSIILLSLERGDQRMEITREDVKSLSVESTTVRIFLDQTKYVGVISAFSEQIYEVLEREGWTR